MNLFLIFKKMSNVEKCLGSICRKFSKVVPANVSSITNYLALKDDAPA